MRTRLLTTATHIIALAMAQKGRALLLQASIAAIALVVPVAAAAQSTGAPITYKINQPIGKGSVVGTIETDGTVGTLSKSNIIGWNLTLTGVGASTTLTSTGGSSVVLLIGGDVSATTKKLFFNYSGKDTGFISFQAAYPGPGSGQKYTCNNTTYFGCSAGASVVPASSTDPSAQYDGSYTGLQILGTAGLAISDQDLLNSILALASARTSQMLTNQLFDRLLLGLNEQVNCGSCGGAGAGFGSFSLSAHGRRALSPEWTILGGVQGGQYDSKGANVALNLGFAVGLQFDPANMGSSRPYAALDVSGSLQNTNYTRSYPGGTGTGRARDYSVSASAKVGWVDRVTPRDEAAIDVSYTRIWQFVGQYAESAGDANPINATVPGGTDTVNIASLNTQYTHLFGRRIEASLNGGINWAFSSQSGLRANIGDVTVSGDQPAFVYYETGGRLGVRMSRRLTVDVFGNAILAPQSIGSSLHGGFDVRWSF